MQKYKTVYTKFQILEKYYLFSISALKIKNKFLDNLLPGGHINCRLKMFQKKPVKNTL